MNERTANILHTIELTKELLTQADLGDMSRDDDSCGVLYGIMRDSAYRILSAAEREKIRHIDRGIWDDSPENHV